MVKTVLIIDDSMDFRELCGQALRMEGCESIAFSNGLLALEYLREAKSLPVVVFVDLVMPEMGGDEFLKAIRSDPRLGSLNVIVTSGRDNLKNRASDMGASGYLRKPFELDHFRKLVRAAASAN